MKQRARPSSHLPVLLVVAASAVACTSAQNAPRSSAAAMNDIERVIDEMLAEERKALRARTTERADAPPVAMPEVHTGEVFPQLQAPTPEESTDTFTEDVLRIQQVVPTWNNGTGIALKFLRESSGARVSLIYVDPTPPAWKTGDDHWVIQATAKTESATLGHFVLLLKDLSPGHYKGSAAEDTVVMATSMAEEWNADDPDTTWSRNHESWCEIVLREGREAGTVEGQFRAKLIDNQGTGFHNIESGYIYIKQ